MQGEYGQKCHWGVLLVVMLALAGCSSGPARKAPVEDRGTALKHVVPGTSTGTANPIAAPEPVSRPGYYTVKPGDTLIRISLETGQSWRDIARWNNIDNPNQIEVGQVLRIAGNVPLPVQPVASGGEDANGVVTRPVTSTSVTPTPAGAVSSVAASSARAPASSPATSTATSTAASTAATAPTNAPGAAVAPVAAAKAPAGEDEPSFIWPVGGSVIHAFDDPKNKGIDLAGKQGDPVLAAADGRVVYAGAGLRGYGNLVVLKHNNVFTTAYAHNHVVLVKEDQMVRKGQKIAEMGSSDADRVKLHFEMRRQFKPVDPAKYLPAR